MQWTFLDPVQNMKMNRGSRAVQGPIIQWWRQTHILIIWKQTWQWRAPWRGQRGIHKTADGRKCRLQDTGWLLRGGGIPMGPWRMARVLTKSGVGGLGGWTLGAKARKSVKGLSMMRAEETEGGAVGRRLPGPWEPKPGAWSASGGQQGLQSAGKNDPGKVLEKADAIRSLT